MTALVVTSTVGGIAYSLGYGRGRNKAIATEDLPPVQLKLPSDPLRVIPEVVTDPGMGDRSVKELPSSAETRSGSLEHSSGNSAGSLSGNLSRDPSDTPSGNLAKASGELSASVAEMSRMARVDIIEELIQDLQSPDSAQRRKAIWELGQKGDSRAVQPLVEIMIDSDSSQRSLILAAISEIGIKTLKPVNRALMLSLQDSSSDVRKNGIRDVTRIYDLVGQISQLLQHATTDPDQEVQETANWALTQLNRIRPLSGSGTDLPSLPSGLTFKELEPADEKSSGSNGNGGNSNGNGGNGAYPTTVE